MKSTTMSGSSLTSTKQKPESLEFNVLYCKSSMKKRKTQSDGILRILSTNANDVSLKTLVLVSDEGVELAKKNQKLNKDLCVGENLSLFGYEVEIDSEVAPKISTQSPFSTHSLEGKKNDSSVTQPLTCAAISRPFVLQTPVAMKMEHSTPITHQFASPPVASSSSNLARCEVGADKRGGSVSQLCLAESVQKKPSIFDVDKAVARNLKDHQVTAVSFLSECLWEKDHSLSFVEAMSSCLEKDHSEDDEESVDSDFVEQQAPKKKRSKTREKSDLTTTGAVLADEMGLGKTLTAIAVMWMFLRNQQRRCVIVCPSSVVDNWKKELNRWLPNCKLLPLILQSGGADSSCLLAQFCSKKVTERNSVLLTSYELFRKHAAKINESPALELLICDEGHRIKNIAGTQTIDALRQCKAFRRLVLTGTPLQNDLDELFAVISFIAPGYLGTHNQFRQLVSIPIENQRRQLTATSSSSATAALDESRITAALREYLQGIVIRRTQASLADGTLPPRTMVTVYCNLSKHQQDAYNCVSQQLVRTLGLLVPTCTLQGDDENESAEGGGVDEDEFEYEAEVDCGMNMQGVVLPAIQQLRQLCTAARDEDTTTLFSSKYQILESYLNSLRQLDPAVKVVIVSNFTSTLDDIQELGKIHKWKGLRLDGSVPATKRQGLVDSFNLKGNDYFIFLLSARAGGVGLNLTAASRLWLVDCDWNPATDAQAMARIWRQGQTKPVIIYRLIAARTIEEAIFQRQHEKNKLNVLVGDAAQEEGDCCPDGSRHLELMTKTDVRRLLFPRCAAGDVCSAGINDAAFISVVNGDMGIISGVQIKN